MAESIPPIAPIPATIPPITNAQTAETPITPDAAQNTGANEPGKDTQADPKTEAQAEKTFTQADVDRIVQNRLRAAKADLKKKLTGESEELTVEDLQRQLSDSATRAQIAEAREAVEDYLSDAANKLNINPANKQAIKKLVMAEIEYADDGTPSNLKDAVQSVKTLAPTLFVNSAVSINAGQGRNGHNPTNDMNQFIRDQHARR